MDPLLYTGYVGGICTTLAFLPQVIKTWKSRTAHDISWGLLFLLLVGVSLWVIYGIVDKDPPLIAANTVTGSLIAALVGMKWWFAHKSTGRDDTD
ncbi:MAG: SemiSWEET transporter [Methanospirillaceae archaeon]|nr:SemiSWEET transporter [Methanospirillaceae archaeon]